MNFYWYDEKTGIPKIAVGSTFMLAGTLPLCLIAVVSLYMQIHGLLKMSEVGYFWRLINLVLLGLNLHQFILTIVSNPGIDKAIFRKRVSITGQFSEVP